MQAADECTVMLWLARELANHGALCCLKHFKDGGRGGSRRPRCKADRRCVEDCGSD